MPQEYKIWHGRSVTHIIPRSSDYEAIHAKMFAHDKETESIIFSNANITRAPSGNELVVADDPKAVFEELFKDHERILAGGGLVLNDNNELLMIFRKGQWDLPKGKLDPGETIEQCAMREVEEETGIAILAITEFVEVSYHTYPFGDAMVLKETSWFKMKPIDSNAIPRPQKAEDIKRVEWLSKTKWKKKRYQMYPMISDFLWSNM